MPGSPEGSERVALLGGSVGGSPLPPSSPDSAGAGASYTGFDADGGPRSSSGFVHDSAHPSPLEGSRDGVVDVVSEPGVTRSYRGDRTSNPPSASGMPPPAAAGKPPAMPPGHGNGGDPSRCPFASLIAEAEAEIAARAMPTPFDHAAAAAEITASFALSSTKPAAVPAKSALARDSVDEMHGKPDVRGFRVAPGKPEVLGPADSKGVARQSSIGKGSVAPSASSQHSEGSEALGAAFLSNSDTAHLGLAKLNRSEWSMDVGPPPPHPTPTSPR